MNIATVVGTVVATVKDPSLSGSRLFVIEPEGGNPLVAVDTVGSRVGDRVIWVASREAALACEETFTPVDAAITGIVDDIHQEKL